MQNANEESVKFNSIEERDKAINGIKEKIKDYEEGELAKKYNKQKYTNVVIFQCALYFFNILTILIMFLMPMTAELIEQRFFSLVLIFGGIILVNLASAIIGGRNSILEREKCNLVNSIADIIFNVALWVTNLLIIVFVLFMDVSFELETMSFGIISNAIMIVSRLLCMRIHFKDEIKNYEVYIMSALWGAGMGGIAGCLVGILSL